MSLTGGDEKMESAKHIKTNLQTEIPQELISAGLFRFPLNGYYFPERGFPNPPMEISTDSGKEVYLIECLFKGQSIIVDPNGEISVHINNGINPEFVREAVNMLPALWNWALGIRQKQDEILEDIRSLLKGWEITLLEEERDCFYEENLKRIKHRLEKFVQAGETVNQQWRCPSRNVENLLSNIWKETMPGYYEQLESNDSLRAHCIIRNRLLREEDDKRRQIVKNILSETGLL